MQKHLQIVAFLEVQDHQVNFWPPFHFQSEQNKTSITIAFKF